MKPELYYARLSEVREVKQLDHPAQRPKLLGPKSYNYKPASLRNLALVTTIVSLLALIGLLEFAVVKLPVNQSEDIDSNGIPVSQKRSAISDVVYNALAKLPANETAKFTTFSEHDLIPRFAIRQASSSTAPQPTLVSDSSSEAATTVIGIGVTIAKLAEETTLTASARPSSMLLNETLAGDRTEETSEMSMDVQMAHITPTLATTTTRRISWHRTNGDPLHRDRDDFARTQNKRRVNVGPRTIEALEEAGSDLSWSTPLDTSPTIASRTDVPTMDVTTTPPVGRSTLLPTGSQLWEDLSVILASSPTSQMARHAPSTSGFQAAPAAWQHDPPHPPKGKYVRTHNKRLATVGPETVAVLGGDLDLSWESTQHTSLTVLSRPDQPTMIVAAAPLVEQPTPLLTEGPIHGYQRSTTLSAASASDLTRRALSTSTRVPVGKGTRDFPHRYVRTHNKRQAVVRSNTVAALESNSNLPVSTTHDGSPMICASLDKPTMDPGVTPPVEQPTPLPTESLLYEDEYSARLASTLTVGLARRAPATKGGGGQFDGPIRPKPDRFVRTYNKRQAPIGAMTAIVHEEAEVSVSWNATHTVTPASSTPTAEANLGVNATSRQEQITSDSQGTEPDDAEIEQDQPPAMDYTWTEGQIFVASYLAVLLAVICRVIISTIANSLSLIDPFLQLAKHNGASADEALFSSHHEQLGIMGILRAIRNSRWALVSMSLASLVACLLPALASEAIVADTNWDCPYPEVGHPNPCPARLAASPAVIRAAQAILMLVVALLLCLLGTLSNSTTGLPNDPSSIAAIARLMGPVASDFVLDAEVDDKSDLRRAFQDKTYRLGFDASTYRYGINTQPSAVCDSMVDFASPDRPTIPSGASRTRTIKSLRDATASLRTPFSDVLLLALVLAAFGVILAYHLDTSYSGFNNYLISNTFGPRFILTGAGTAIATLWKNAEQRSMIMAPFRQMAKGSSVARDTIHFEPTTTPLVSTYTAIKSRYWTVAVVTLMTLLAELLSILIGSIPFAPGQTFYQYLLASYLCMSILGAMILGVAVLLLGRRHEPKIPFLPDTLGTKMYYLAGSRVSDELVDVERPQPSSHNAKYVFRQALEKNGSAKWVVEASDQSDGSA